MSTPFPAALTGLAQADPDAPAITDGSGTLTRGEPDRLSTHVARAFAEAGVTLGDFVSISLPSDRPFLIAAIAAHGRAGQLDLAFWNGLSRCGGIRRGCARRRGWSRSRRRPGAR